MSDESDWNAQIIEEFRANDGKLGGMFEGADVLLLHHTGSKTGIERVNPLGYQRVGGAYAVFGSNSGKTSDPMWVNNLRAHPRARRRSGRIRSRSSPVLRRATNARRSGSARRRTSRSSPSTRRRRTATSPS